MARGARNPPAEWQPPPYSARKSAPEKGKIVGSTGAVAERKIVKSRAVGKGKSVKIRPVDSDEDERPYERSKTRPDDRRRYLHPEEICYDDLSGEELEPDYHEKYHHFVRQGRITSKEYHDRLTRSKTYQRYSIQANSSQGFDVEQLIPLSQIPRIIPWSYIKEKSHESLNEVFGYAELALRRYNGRFRKSYKVVDVVKWNKEQIGPHHCYYITFNVKKEGTNNGPPRTFQGKVAVHCVTKKPLVDLCRPRPAKKSN